jgi:DNA polymerase III subunit delta
MSASAPSVYLLNGEDEFAIAESLAGLEARLGEDSTVSLNLTRLDGRSVNLDELPSIALAVPFLARRRIVVLTYPTARINSEAAQARFCQLLVKIPPTTALVLVEYRLLTSPKARKKGELHWLEKWAVEHPEIALVKDFPLPVRWKMQAWIRERTRDYGGQITGEAAQLLEALLGTEKRLADQEIQKLLAFVNYQRPVEREDVERLVADAGQTDIFILVDALGNGDSSKAMNMLQRLLDDQEPGGIFGMVVRQFRLLLQAREILDEGGSSREVASQLGIQAFLANKIVDQARQFSLSRLEQIYHQLLKADLAVKTGEIPANLSLEMLVVDLQGK